MKTDENFIELKPSWTGLMPALFVLLESGSPQGRAEAKKELMRLAKAVDEMNERNKEETP